MLYLVLIASLYIFKVSAQGCDVPRVCETCSTIDACTDIGINCQWDGEGCVDNPTPAPVTPEPTTAEPTQSPTYECPTTLSSSADCSTIYDLDCCTNYDECKVADKGICNSEDASPDECCTAETPSPTTPAPVTDEPTLSPTCPTDLKTCEDYEDYGSACCPDTCIADTSALCLSEGGEGCCITTPAPTTPEPTTPEPTTPEPTTPEPTTPEPTTPEPTTPEPTTPEPTTPSPTTPEPTTSTTEESSEESSTTESSDSSDDDTPSPTKYNRWPTPKPTLPSAEKWEMIHPAYKGSDGELLWQVYYGDFSSDDRFDSFRSAEKWDTQEIKPIIMKDAQFKRYRNANSKKFNQQSAVVTDNSGAQSYGTWLIVISAVLILLFAAWYKYGSYNKNKQEYTPLLSEEKIQYDQ